jgi:hypothetical protein
MSPFLKNPRSPPLSLPEGSSVLSAASLAKSPPLPSAARISRAFCSEATRICLDRLFGGGRRDSPGEVGVLDQSLLVGGDTGAEFRLVLEVVATTGDGQELRVDHPVDQHREQHLERHLLELGRQGALQRLHVRSPDRSPIDDGQDRIGGCVDRLERRRRLLGGGGRCGQRGHQDEAGCGGARETGHRESAFRTREG